MGMYLGRYLTQGSFAPRSQRGVCLWSLCWVQQQPMNGLQLAKLEVQSHRYRRHISPASPVWAGRDINMVKCFN